GDEDMWVVDLRTGVMNRLTIGGTGGSAVWTRDGLGMVYAKADRAGGEMVVVRRLDGAGGERVLYRADHPLTVTSLTPDGAEVVFSDYGQKAGRMHLAPLAGGPAAREISAEGEGYELAGAVSPDGRWLAYISNKTRREEVCVRRLGGGASWQVSTGGDAGGVRWGRDGRELFFVAN